MCETSPAPRCATGTRKAVDTAVRQVKDRRDEVYATRERHLANPENKELALEYLNAYRKFKAAQRKLKIAQRDHEGTPTGQKELKESLSTTVDLNERKKLKRRMREADQFRDWRLHHRQQQKLEKDTGLTMRQRRGNFLTNPGMSTAA